MIKNRKKTGKAICVAGILILQTSSAQGGMQELWKTGSSYFGSIAKLATPGLRSFAQSCTVQAVCKNPRKTAATTIASVGLAIGAAGYYIYSCWLERKQADLDYLESLNKEFLVPAPLLNAHMTKIKYSIEKNVNLMSDDEMELYREGREQADEQEREAFKLFAHAAHELKTLKQQKLPLTQKQMDGIKLRCKEAKEGLDQAKEELYQQLIEAQNINVSKGQNNLEHIARCS